MVTPWRLVSVICVNRRIGPAAFLHLGDFVGGFLDILLLLVLVQTSYWIRPATAPSSDHPSRTPGQGIVPGHTRPCPNRMSLNCMKFCGIGRMGHTPQWSMQKWRSSLVFSTVILFIIKTFRSLQYPLEHPSDHYPLQQPVILCRHRHRSFLIHLSVHVPFYHDLLHGCHKDLPLLLQHLHHQVRSRLDDLVHISLGELA